MIRSEFTAHMLNTTGKVKAAQIADGFSVLLNGLEDIIGETGPASARAFALVKTKLEEASFYANKAMAAKTENQE